MSNQQLTLKPPGVSSSPASAPPPSLASAPPIDINGIKNMIDMVAGELKKSGKDGKKQGMKNVVGVVMDKMMAIPGINPDIKTNIKNTVDVLMPVVESYVEDDEEKIDFTPSKNSRVKIYDEDSKPQRQLSVPMITPEQDNLKVLEENYRLGNKEKDSEFMLNPRTKDIIKHLDINLSELYTGVTKKVEITRTRLKKSTKDNKTLGYVEEKKKFLVTIEKGSCDNQTIVFSKQGHEKIGHETGDIIIVLNQNDDSIFSREEDDLFVKQYISLYESYAIPSGEIDLVIRRPDNSKVRVNAIMNEKQIPNGMVMKVSGMGFPKYMKEGRGDMFIEFNILVEQPVTREVLIKNFPPVNPHITNSESLSFPTTVRDYDMKSELVHLTAEDLKRIQSYFGEEYDEDEDEDEEYTDDEDEDEDEEEEEFDLDKDQ
jgi:DnaJ-class molecular chaperone